MRQYIGVRRQQTAQTPSELNSSPSLMKDHLLMPVPNELLSGTCQQLLFSSKRGIEGELMKVKGAVLQLSMQADVGAASVRSFGPRKRLRVLAAARHGSGRPGRRHQGQRGRRTAHDGAGHSAAVSARGQSHRTRLKLAPAGCTHHQCHRKASL